MQRKLVTSTTAEGVPAETTIHDNDTAVLVSFELTQKSWILTIRLPGTEESCATASPPATPAK